ncbi:MAG: DNA gyrase inhibitor YacG [Acidobacteria bacterium]|nr:DNA gyrase inhibitor YacG [Acidobacteriota bacterium]
MPSKPLCVYCRQRAAEDRFRPFCSERCKMADLGRWLTGAYQVPGPPSSQADRPDDAEALDERIDDDGRFR